MQPKKENPGAGDAGAEGIRIVDEDSNTNTAIASAIQAPDAIEAMLDLFFERACELAHRVELGGIGFLDAVDMCWSSAEWSGLVDLAGPDLTQHVLACAFMAAPKGGAA